MAQLTQGRVDIISREDGTLISQANSGSSHTVILNQPSVVRINGTREMVAQYERQGNDLILHMRDGSTVRYQKFFFDDLNGEHSELVFDDGINPAEHALFPTTAGVTDTAAVAMTPSYESLGSVEPLLLAETDNVSTGVIAASGLGILGLGGIALGAGGGGGGGNDNNGGSVTPVPPETATPVIAVNAFASDDILDNGEKGSAQTLGGTTSNVEAGQIVTVTLNGQSYNTTVGADGSWSVSVPASALAALAAGTATFNVSVSNAAGQSASASHDFTVEPAPGEPGNPNEPGNPDEPGVPAAPTLSVNAFAGDDILDNGEKGSAQILVGTTSNVEAGQIVTVTLNGQSYNATVGADGSWSVSLPASALAALAAGTATFNVSVSNAAGQSAAASHDFIVEPAPGEPGLIVITEPLSGDGYLNAQEAASDLAVSGRTVGVAAGSVVTVNFNGASYSGTVNADGSWSVTVPAAASGNLNDGVQTLTATVTDANDNVLNDDASLNVIVDTLPAVSLNSSAFTDGLLNAAEAGSDQTLSGNTGVSAAGQQVTVSLNGQRYSAAVNEDGSWSLTLPATALQNLPQGNNSLTVTVSDAAGNSSSDSLAFSVDTLQPVLIVNPVAGDNMLNSIEAGSDLPVTGTGAPGETVAVALNGQTYSAIVGDNGSWTVTVPAADLTTLADGSAYTVGVTLTDAEGNVTSATQTLAVDTRLPTLVVNTPAGDGVLNNNELQQPLVLSGSGTPGSTVAVTLNEVTYNAAVDNNGQWSLSIPNSDLAALDNGDYPLGVAITDVAGNTTAQETTLTIASATPLLTVDTLGGDGVINAADATQPLAVTGSGTTGDTISVSLNGQTYTATVGNDGQWSVSVPASDLAQVPAGDQTVTVTATDAQGNTTTTPETLNFSTTPPTVSITQPASDGYINAGESNQDLVLDGSGGTSGNSVEVQLNGTTYTTTVGDDGTWVVTVPSADVGQLGDGVYPVTVTVTDSAGNSSTSTSDVTVVADVTPTLTIDPVAGDGVLDRAEQLSDLLFTGTTNVAPGQTVNVVVNGSSYDGTVQPGGSWAVSIPAGALSGLTGTQNVTVSVSDVAGNNITQSQSFDVLVSDAPQLAIAPITGDNALNAVEATSDLTLTGSSANLPANAVITVTLNNVSYSATVTEGGGWAVTIPTADLTRLPQGAQAVTVTANGVTITQTLDVATLPLSAPTLETPFGDNVLNSAEANSLQTLSGTAGAGLGVAVTLGGVSYQTTADENGNWSLDLPPTALQTLPQGNNILAVTTSDAAGNSSTISQTVTVDTGTPAVQVNPIAADGTINASEAQSDLTLTGSVTPGNTVSLQLGDETYSATVASDGSWSATIPAADLQALSDGRYDLSVTVATPNGNSATTPFPVTVDTAAPAFTLNTLAGDGILNASEQAQPLTLSGSGSEGDNVSVTLNGVSYTTTVGNDGSWSLVMPAGDLAALSDGDYPVGITVSDSAGNSSSDQTTLVVDVTSPPVTVDPVSGNGTLNTNDLTQPLILSGSGQYGDSVAAELNGKVYRALVAVNGRWSLQIPQSDLAALPNGDNPLTVTITDAQGNQTVQSSTLVVDADPATQPTITLDSAAFAGNNIVDAAEQQQPQTLTGTTTNVEQGQVVTVTLNGVSYSGLVEASGSWSVTLPAGALADLSDGSQTLNVVVSDTSGNSATAEAAFTLNTALSSVALAPVGGNNYLSAAEIAGDLTVSGSTSNVAEGSIVTVTLNGVSYSAAVNADGSWSTLVPAGALNGVADGPLTLDTSVIDNAGNTVTTASTLNVLAATQPQITLNPAFGDGSLNAADVVADGTLSGSSGISGDGQSVTVSLNGVSYSGTVDGNGNWSIVLPASALGALQQGNNDFSVTLTDIAGNSASSTGSVLVDTVAPTLTLATPSGDGVLNASELAQALPLSGSSEANALIVASINGTTYSTTADPAGNWALTVPAGALSSVADGSYPLIVTATDGAGNVTTSESSITVKASAASLPTLSVNAFAGNDIVDGAERQTDQLLSGTTTNVEPGQTVTVTLNQQIYTAEVQASGSWSVLIPAGALQGLADGNITIGVSVSDAAGNNATGSLPIAINSSASGLSLDAISDDNYLNASEAAQPLIITGSSLNVAPDATITVLFNNQPYTAQAAADGRWSVIVPETALMSLTDGTTQLTVTAVDAAGNPVSATATLNVLINSLPEPAIVSTFGDGTLNAADITQAQTLSGATGVSGDGQTVSVTLNGNDYSGSVDADGNWSVTVPPEALAALTQGNTGFTVNVSDAAGNSNSVGGSVTVDTTPPTLTLNPVAGDDNVNVAESEQVVTLSGSSDAEAGQVVTITLNNQVWTTTVNGDGGWSFDLPAGALADINEGTYLLTATVSDAAGNSITATRDVIVANAALVPTIDQPFGDGYLNINEAAAGQTLTGSTGVSGAGQSVTVSLNNTDYSATVNDDGSWSLTLDNTTLQAIPAGIATIVVTATDAAGNIGTAESNVNVDFTAPGLTIDPITGDDIINSLEVAQDLIISGTASAGDESQPVVVTFTFNGETYQTQVLNNDTWRVTVPASVLQGLPDGDYPISVSLTDAAGNTTTVIDTLTRDADPADLPTLTLDAISGDNYLNQLEAGGDFTVSGGSTGLEAGQLVTVTLNGIAYSAAVAADGSWSATVPAADAGTLPDGLQLVSVSAADASGNPASASSNITVIAGNAAQPVLTFDVIAGDDVLNNQEAGQPLTIRGASQQLAGRTVTVTLNDNDYSATVDANGNWRVTVPSTDLTTLPQGTVTVTASATDIAGNPVTLSSDLTVNSDLPALADITLDAGATLSLADALAGLTVTGSSEAGLPVTVTLNGVAYTTTVAADNSWSLTIPAGDLQQLTDGPQTVQVAVTDADGNTATGSAPLSVIINNLPTLTVSTENTPFADGLLNASEAAGATTLTGAAANLADGTAVSVTIGDLTYTTTVTDNAWSVAIPAGDLAGLDNGVTQISVSAVDAVGNPAQGNAGVEVLLTAPAAPIINASFGDGVINAGEAATTQVITGTAVISDGQTVTVSIGDTPLAVTVDNNGVWTASLTPAQIAALGDGAHTITVTTTDRAGNSTDATQPFTIATAAIAPPTLDTPFDDGRLNLAEAQEGGTLTGQLGAADAESVTVTINGTVYNADINNDGTWSLALPASLLLTLPDGNWPALVTVTDSVGNTASVNGSLLVAINNLPDPTFNLAFGNGALDAAEATATQTLSGNTGVSGAGQSVNVAISGLNDDAPFSAAVDANGNWSLNLTPAQLAGLANGTHTITVTASDIAGNSDTVTQDVVTGVTTSTPTVSGQLFGNGYLSLAEATNGVTLTGSTGNQGENQAVSLSIDIGGVNYTGTVNADGTWSVPIPAGALTSLQNGEHTLNVTAVDAAGNIVTQPFTFTSDFVVPVPTVDAQFNDGYINADDAATGFTLTGSTGETGDGQSVTVTMGTESYTATVTPEGRWSLALTPAQLDVFNDGTYAVSVTATDIAGNSTTISNSLVLDTSAPDLTINAFAADNALNYAESIVPQTLSGTAGGAEAGSLVNVTLGGASLGTATIGADGSWNLVLTPEQMATFTPSTTLAVSVTDLAGNVTSGNATFTVDLTPPPGPLVTLGTVSGDNIISTADVGTVALNGTAANLGADALVNVVIGTTTYTTTIDASGNWTTSVPVADFGSDGNVVITVNATGSDGTTSTSGTVGVDLTPPTVTLNAFAGDNIVNASESDLSQSISGTASISEAGRSVVVTLNNKTYSAIVQSDGSWSTSVPAADMQALPDGQQTITAQLSDAAGNVGSASQPVTVDTTAPLININAFLGDNLINAADVLLTQTLTGTAPGSEGETIALYVGDSAPIATAVVQPDGTFSLDLTPEVLGSLNEGALVFGARITDDAGNQTEATLTVNKIVNQALTLVVDSVFGDGTLSAIDTTVAQTISGVATSAGVGAIVSVEIGGTTLSAAVGQDGQWAIVVPPTLLDLVTNGNLALDITLTDAAGNTRTVGETVTAIVDNVPVVGDLTGLLAGDNLLNAAEAAAGQTIGGVLNAAEGSQVTVTLGTRAYVTRVTAGGNWSIDLPAADLTSLLDGNLTLGLTVVDPAGNVASNTASIGIFTAQPTISLTSLFGDGILNAADILTGQTISGVVNNAVAGSVVTLNVGNSTVTTTVGENGAFSATVNPEILSTLAQGNLTIGASVTDPAGNSASASAGIRVDTILPTVTINPLFGDGLLNVADALVTQAVGGIISGAEAGARVVVSVAGQQFITTTDANGNYSVALTPAILQGIADGNLTVGVSVTDSAGNTASATTGAIVGIHNLPTIVLNPLFGDGVLNLLESTVTQTISGTVANVAAGTGVRISIGNTVLNTTVNQDGTFSAQVTPDLLGTILNGNLTVGVAVTDVVGNTSSVSAGIQLGIANQPTLALNTVFGDGVLSAADLASNQVISGTSTNLTAGTTVSATLNGVTYTGQVTSGGSWSISVPRANLAAIADGTQAVRVTASDAYGNPASASGNLSVISHTPPTVTISSLFGDNALSVADVKTAQTISGSSTNAEGSTVNVTIGNQTFTTTVNSSGAWSLSVPAASLAAIADGSYTVTASITNGAGASGSGSSSLTVLSHSSPTVALNSYFGGDGYLNIAEANTAETISGRATHAVGSTVTVNVAGHVFTTTVTSNGTWSVSVPSATLVSIPDGSHSVTVTVTDAGGNTAITNSTFTSLSHNSPLVGVDPILNVVTSLLVGLTVTGGTANAAPGSAVTVTLLLANGNPGPSVHTTTDALGLFGANFSPSLLSVPGLLLSLGTLARVTVTDVAGNSTTSTNTLLLGGLLPVATTSAAVTTFSAEDAAVSTASVDDSASTATTGTGEETFARMATVAAATTPDSTLTTDADDVTNSTATSSASSSDESTSSTATAAVADDQSYTIGGVVIALADSTTAEGPSVNGSTGADTVTVSDLHFTHIDGGAGSDTLVLNGENMTLDLTALGLKVEHIEIVDLGKSGTNAVKLDLNEALNVTDSQNEDLVIKGADGSQVMLANANGGVWENTGQRALDGQTFDVYHNSALTSDNTLGDVLVQHNLQVHVV